MGTPFLLEERLCLKALERVQDERRVIWDRVQANPVHPICPTRLKWWSAFA